MNMGAILGIIVYIGMAAFMYFAIGAKKNKIEPNDKDEESLRAAMRRRRNRIAAVVVFIILICGAISLALMCLRA